MERITARNENGAKEAYYPYCFREDTCDGDGMSEKCDMCDFPIKICERIAEYEDTGLTPEQIRELAERDTAKDPEEFDGHWYKCPTCGKYAGGLKGNFCHVCGQRLKWEERL